MMVVAFLVGSAFAVIVGALGWGWSRGTLHETDRERVDREFERIVRRLEDV
jgi:hypothetical protein